MKRRILIVDDQPVNLDICRLVLREEGYDCRTFECGIEALKCLRTWPADLVLSDLEMPRIHGLRLLHEVHAMAPDTPVIIMSGRSGGDTVRAVMESGAAAFIAKPFSQHSLTAAIRRVLDSRTAAADRPVHGVGAGPGEPAVAAQQTVAARNVAAAS
jgi:DNA-binding NtrC family response regulator